MAPFVAVVPGKGAPARPDDAHGRPDVFGPERFLLLQLRKKYFFAVYTLYQCSIHTQMVWCFNIQKKITIVKCALFITTQNGELGDECKDIWHVQAQDENSGESSGRVAQAMNCVNV